MTEFMLQDAEVSAARCRSLGSKMQKSRRQDAEVPAARCRSPNDKMQKLKKAGVFLQNKT